MSDFDFLLASFGLLFCAGGVIVWFYLQRVKSLHRCLKRRLDAALNAEDGDDRKISGGDPRSFFKIPLYLKLVVAGLLAASGVCLVFAVVRLEPTVMKTILLFTAITLWMFMAAYAWRHVRSNLPRRRGKIWYEDD